MCPYRVASLGLSGICTLDWFTAGEDMDVFILVMWSYEPAVIFSGVVSLEESQKDIPMIISGKGFLARTTNLPTQRKQKRKIGLDWEQRHCSKSCWIGSGCWHWSHASLTPSVPLCQHGAPASAPTWLSDVHRFKDPGGDIISLLDGAYATLMPAGWGRITQWALLKRLWSCLWAFWFTVKHFSGLCTHIK